MISGFSLVGGESIVESGPTFSVKRRNDGAPLEGTFTCASRATVDRAAELAHEAFRTYASAPQSVRAALLREIATGLEADVDAIVARAMAESALPEARLKGEMGRTAGQLRFFAGIVDDGTWEDHRVDSPDPGRTPIPKPRVESRLHPLGPVVVFGASNFPLAFSVAGGDTASALAAGCPVIVKGHPAHPGTCELVARIVVDACEKVGVPSGVFALIVDNESTMAGEALVKHPRIKAGGFTGSKRVGTHLWRLATSRPEPIPFYAEMGSVNPVVVMPSAAARDGFAKALAGSATLGVGQFCTNPGVVLVVGNEARAFADAYKAEMAAIAPAPMLTENIEATYLLAAERMADHLDAGCCLLPTKGGAPAVFVISAQEFIDEPALREEVFGPATALVLCADESEALRSLESLDGQLTASVHGEPGEYSQDLVWAMSQIAGRVIFNQFPTGVEVGQAMVHGGPFPATSDSRSTSVGGRAITRWARPIAFQSAT